MNIESFLHKDIIKIILSFCDNELLCIYRLINKQWLNCIKDNYKKQSIKQIICYCCKNGYLSLLQWLQNYCIFSLLPLSSFCDITIQYNQLKILQWFLYNYPTIKLEHPFIHACCYGNLEIIKWLKQENQYQWSEQACAYAAQYGHIHILEWLRNQNPPCPWNEWSCLYTAEKGNLETLKWLRNQNPPCPWNERVCMGAIYYGRIEILKWLVENGCPITKNCLFLGTSSKEIEIYLKNLFK